MHSQALPSDQQLVMWSHWTRLDARLAEILVQYLPAHFYRIHPLTLRQANLGKPCPQVMGLLLEFATDVARAKLPSSQFQDFLKWVEVICHDVNAADAQLFFLPPGWPNPAKYDQLHGRTLRPFAKWGFIEADDLLNLKFRQTQRGRTLLTKSDRNARLLELLRHQTRIFLGDYLKACEGLVHRRTAERDLAECTEIQRDGKTRGRTYTLAKKSSLRAARRL